MTGVPDICGQHVHGAHSVHAGSNTGSAVCCCCNVCGQHVRATLTAVARVLQHARNRRSVCMVQLRPAHERVCLQPGLRPVLEDFMAVEFVLKMELCLTSVIPQLLQPEVLQWLAMVSNAIEHHRTHHSSVAGFTTVLLVPGSVYHTQDLSSVVPQVIQVRARQLNYESLAMNTEWQSRSNLCSTDIKVQGLNIMPSMPNLLFSDKDWIMFTKKSMQDAVTLVSKPDCVDDWRLQKSTCAGPSRRSSSATLTFRCSQAQCYS